MVDVQRKQVELAARALLTHHKKQNRDFLLAEGESVWVQLIRGRQCVFKQTPSAQKQPKRIPLAHGLYDERTSDICLITKDPQAEYEELAASKNLPGRVTVMSVSKLRSDFKPYEAKRKLFQSFDLFLADDRVLDVLPKLLGKTFFAAKRQPVPVKISGKGGDWAAQVVKARDATYLHIGKGPCSALRVGTTDFTAAQLAENIMLVIEGLGKHDARKGKNIQAIHVKTDSSLALPVYNSVPTASDITHFGGVVAPRKKKVAAEAAAPKAIEAPPAAKREERKRKATKEKVEDSAEEALATPKAKAKAGASKGAESAKRPKKAKVDTPKSTRKASKSKKAGK